MKLETASKLFVLLLASEAIYTDIGTIGIYIYINPETCMVGVDLYIATNQLNDGKGSGSDSQKLGAIWTIHHEFWWNHNGLLILVGYLHGIANFHHGYIGAGCLVSSPAIGLSFWGNMARCFFDTMIAMVGSACANLVVYMIDTLVFTYLDAYTKTMVA